MSAASAPVPCRTCKRAIRLAILATTNRWGVFDADPVDDLLKDSNRHWVLSGRQAAPVATFVDALQQRARLPLERAHAAARADFPWHRFHDCPNRQVDEGGTRA